MSGFAATAGTLQFHEERVEGGEPGRKWDPGYGGAGPAVVHRRPAIERIRLDTYIGMAFSNLVALAIMITTVSPTYAREIQTHEQGCGLDGLLRKRRQVLSGILNGVDRAVWDPASDRTLATDPTRPSALGHGRKRVVTRGRRAAPTSATPRAPPRAARTFGRRSAALINPARPDRVSLPHRPAR